jgi:hypothetical protein
MLEALWSVEFSSNAQGFGAGVIVFESSRAFGGDAQYFYIGRYKIVDGILKAEAKVTHYANLPNSIFGPLKEFNLRLEGKIAEPTFDLKGYLVERPEMKIIARLTKRADLP